MGSSTMKCIKCESVELVDNGDDFFACPDCNRRFHLKEDGTLTERWLGPISMVLYPVIFTLTPQSRASEIAESLYQSTIPDGKSLFRSFTSEQIQYIVNEIEIELAQPTQKVKDILGCNGSESDLREYLSLVAEQLKDKMQ
jgi:hypothetical protein